MKIAVLAWGSLIWEKNRPLEVTQDWKMNGPHLPIEFARISALLDDSRPRRITLVIKENWPKVQVCLGECYLNFV